MPSNNKHSRVKSPCKICFETVTEKTGLRCEGACKKWLHFKCLSYSPEKIQDILDGIIRIRCPCPNCDTKEKDVRGSKNCGKSLCPAGINPEYNAEKCLTTKPTIPGYPKPVSPEQRGFKDGELRLSCDGKTLGITSPPKDRAMRHSCQKGLKGQIRPKKQHRETCDPKCCSAKKTCESCDPQCRSANRSTDEEEENCARNIDYEEYNRQYIRLELKEQSDSYVSRSSLYSVQSEQYDMAKLLNSKIDLWPSPPASSSIPTLSVRNRRVASLFKKSTKASKCYGQDMSLQTSFADYKRKEDATVSISLPSIVPSTQGTKFPGIYTVKNCTSVISDSLSYTTCKRINNIIEQMYQTMGLLRTQFKDLLQKMVPDIALDDLDLHSCYFK